MASFSQPEIDRIMDNYNQSFEYASNEHKLKKRKLFINHLVDKFSPPSDGGDSISPYSHLHFITRVSTFDSARWFAKPSCISSFECARRGWKNICTDRLICEFCRSELIHEASDVSGNALKERLTTSHKSFCGWGTNHCPPEFCSIYYGTSNGEALYQRVWDEGILPVCSSGSNTSQLMDTLKIAANGKDIAQWKHDQAGSHNHSDAVKLVESLLRLVESSFVSGYDRIELGRVKGLLQYKSREHSGLLSKLSTICNKLIALPTTELVASGESLPPVDEILLLQRFLKSCILGIFGWTCADSQLPLDSIASAGRSLRCHACARNVPLPLSVPFDLLFQHKCCCPFITQCNDLSNNSVTPVVVSPDTNDFGSDNNQLPGWLVYARLFLDHSE
jgi:hypothetical protein